MLNFKNFIKEDITAGSTIRNRKAVTSKSMSDFGDNVPPIVPRFGGDLASGIGGFYNAVKSTSTTQQNIPSHFYRNNDKNSLDKNKNEYTIEGVADILLYMIDTHGNFLDWQRKITTDRSKARKSNDAEIRIKCEAYLLDLYTKDPTVKKDLDENNLDPNDFSYLKYTYKRDENGEILKDKKNRELINITFKINDKME